MHAEGTLKQAMSCCPYLDRRICSDRKVIRVKIPRTSRTCCGDVVPLRMQALGGRWKGLTMSEIQIVSQFVRVVFLEAGENVVALGEPASFVAIVVKTRDQPFHA